MNTINAQTIINEAMAPSEAPINSVAGQKHLFNRAGRIASLKMMNEQIRKIDASEAWHDSNIENESGLDALQDRISQCLVDLQRSAELVTCEAGESEASAPTAGRASWAPVPQYVPPSLSQVKPGEPVPPAYRGGMDDIDPPSDGNAEPTTRPMGSADFSGDIPLSLAVSAFGGVSMSPDRRGLSAKNEYGQSMAADYETLHAQAVKGGTLELLPEVFARYRERQASAYRAYLSSSSRCVSSFIAGPANFPVARMQKRNDIAHKRLNEYLDGGKMALQSAIRQLRPDLRAIMSGDADAIDRLTVKIEAAERAQAQMKAANKAIRANAKQGEAHQIAALMELGYRESDATELVKPSQHWRSVGFASYSLTNNNANIRRMKERLEQISKAQAQEVQAVECANGVTLEDDAPANRVRLFFPGKPAEAIRDELKSSGFRWAPSVGAWQAYRNHGTLATARRMAGEPLPAAPEVTEVEQVGQVEQVEQVEATPTVAVSTEVPTHAPVESQPEAAAPAVETAQDVPAVDAASLVNAGFPAVAAETIAHHGIDAYGPGAQAEIRQKLADAPAPAAPTLQSEWLAATQTNRIEGKSGKWLAWFWMTSAGVIALGFSKQGQAVELNTYNTASERMTALQSMARAADAPTDTPPGGGLPCPAEAPTTPVATSTPGTPVAVSSAAKHRRNIVPDNGLHIVEDAFEAWTFTSGARFAFVMYLGKSAKPWKYYGYSTEAKRNEGFQRYAADAREILANKAKRKADSKAQADKPHGLQVGDVVRNSWGYDQTNVNHYQIIKVIGKRTVEVRELNENHESTGDMTGRASPIWGDFAGEPMRRQVDKHGQVNIMSRSYGRASKIEPLAIVHGVRCYAATSYSSYA